MNEHLPRKYVLKSSRLITRAISKQMGSIVADKELGDLNGFASQAGPQVDDGSR